MRPTVDTYGQGKVQTTNLVGSESYSSKKICCFRKGRAGSSPASDTEKVSGLGC